MRSKKFPRVAKPQGRYLEHATGIDIRFQEVDSMQVVWHGHYVTYFEDARVAFGRKYGLSYEDIRNANLAAPIVHLSCDYHHPAAYGERIEVIARLYFRDSAKLEFYYEIYRSSDKMLLSTGRSVQVFTDFDGTLRIVMPDLLRRFYARWEKSSHE